jgi:hypothetical protein
MDAIQFPAGVIPFSSPQRPDRLSDPPSLYPMGTEVLLPGIKRLGRDTDHSPPSSAKGEE